MNEENFEKNSVSDSNAVVSAVPEAEAKEPAPVIAEAETKEPASAVFSEPAPAPVVPETEAKEPAPAPSESAPAPAASSEPATAFSGTAAAPVYRSPYMSDEEHRLKSDIRRLSLGIAIPFMILCIAPYVISHGLRYAVEAVMGYSYTYKLFTSVVFTNALNALSTILLFTLPFLIIPAVTKSNLRKAVSFNKPKSGTTLGLVMLGLGVCRISNIAASYFVALLESVLGSSVGTVTNYSSDSTHFLFSLVTVGILPAVFEEFALRGVVLGTLRRYFGNGTSIILSAALFGLMHGNIRQIPFAFGVGLVLGYAVCYSGSILPAMLIHFANNILTVLLQYLNGFLSPAVSSVISSLYGSMLIIIGVCGFLILLKNDEHFLKTGLSDSANAENTGKKMGWLLSSAAMIIYSVVETLYVLGSL